MHNIYNNKRILVIDDNPAMVEIVKSILNREGATAFGATDPRKGLELVLSDRIDAVILDRYMPEKDGNEVLRQMKSDRETQSIPVVMLTGESNASKIRESLKLGASGYLIKPFTPKDFLAQLAKILEKNQFYIA